MNPVISFSTTSDTDPRRSADHRRATRHRLSHHDPEVLLPLDREEQAARSRQQVLLGGGVRLTDPVDIWSETRLDLSLEIVMLARFVALPRKHERPARFPSRIDRKVWPFLGAHAAEEEHELVLVCAERIFLHRDRVVHRCNPRHVGRVAALGLGDRDEGDIRMQRTVVIAELALDGSMCSHHGGDGASARGQWSANE
jgi:hypothetical protein